MRIFMDLRGSFLILFVEVNDCKSLYMFITQMTAAELTQSPLVGNKGTFSLYYTTAVSANIKLTGGSC